MQDDMREKGKSTKLSRILEKFYILYTCYIPSRFFFSLPVITFSVLKIYEILFLPCLKNGKTSRIQCMMKKDEKLRHVFIICDILCRFRTCGRDKCKCFNDDIQSSWSARLPQLTEIL